MGKPGGTAPATGLFLVLICLTRWAADWTLLGPATQLRGLSLKKPPVPPPWHLRAGPTLVTARPLCACLVLLAHGPESGRVYVSHTCSRWHSATGPGHRYTAKALRQMRCRVHRIGCVPLPWASAWWRVGRVDITRYGSFCTGPSIFPGDRPGVEGRGAPDKPRDT